MSLATAVHAAAAVYRDLTLQQAIRLLENAGLSILYSSDLVKPTMRVEEEPAAGDPRSILEAIVVPHGLAVAEGPNGSLLLVRAQPVARAGVISGRLSRVNDGTPVSGTTVRLQPGGQQATTDQAGRFRFDSVPAGRHVLRVSDELAQLAREYAVTLGAGENAEAAILVFDLTMPDLAEVIVNASQYALVREPAAPAASLTAAELQLLPDIGDDPLRAVSRLPGAASGEFTAKANLRGGEADETLVRFDGLRLYNPFHLKDFQSVFSTIDPGLVRGMDVYTGGFPVTYGDRMSGVIDIRPLAPDRELHREVSLSFFSASAMAAGRFNEGDSDWLVSARRGNLDLIFDVVDPKLGDPKYVDLYARLGQVLSDSLSVSANFLLFDDDLLLSDSDVEEQARADYRDEYYWLRFNYRAAEALHGSLLAARSELDSNRRGVADQPGVSVGTLQDQRSFTIDSLQTDWSLRVAEEILLRFGAEAQIMDGRYDYSDDVEFDLLFVAPGASQEPARSRTLSARPDGNHYGAYASLRVEPFRQLTADAGLRWDRESLSPDRDEQLSPRFNVLFRVNESTDLRAGWGRFFQSQAVNELQISDGVTEFFPMQQADQLIVSLEHRHASGIALRLEAYRKEYQHLRPRFENLLNTFILLPELKPDRIRIAPDKSTSRGVELSLRRADRGPLGWWLSYTWSSAKDRITGDDLRRSWDQTHLVTAGVSWQAESWEMSLAGGYHTGWPTTDIELVDAEPLPLAIAGPRNAERLAFYRTLDARVARKFRFESAGDLTVFLELTNVLNRRNDCCVEYAVEDEDGELVFDSEAVDYLPAFPSLGFIWQF